MLQVGSRLLLDPIMSTSLESHLQKVLMHGGIHATIIGTWDPCEVIRSNFHDLNGGDYNDVNWDLGLGTHVNRP